jgi:hypothetical protein
MTKQSDSNREDEIAALRAEVDALKAAQPKPQQTAEEIAASAAKFRDEMHQMREGRMSMATPPSVVREFAVLDDNLVKGIALRDSRAPTGPSSQGAIPSLQQVSNVRGTGGVPGLGTGWSHATPLAADDSGRESLRERCFPYGEDDDVK